jgi:hypothetical protein
MIQILESVLLIVVYTCNPSYSGSSDQEDHGSRPAQAKSQTLSQKYSTQKKSPTPVLPINK